MRLLQYKAGSKSARALSGALGIKRVNRENSRFRNNYDHTILNWGCSAFDNSFPVTNWINHPDAVKVASNKLSCFRALQEAIPDNIPEFTNDLDTAQQWADDGRTIVIREKLTGHSGEGIFIYNLAESSAGMPHDHQGEVHPAPLFVQYIKKAKEYRVHVINGRVVDVQEKRKRRSVENDLVDYRVRNSGNGWVYCRDDVDYGVELVDLAVDSVRCLGLDFGAVDVIYNSHYDKYYVLEVNTACGLENTTLDNYVEHLRSM